MSYGEETVFVKHKKDQDAFSVWSLFLVGIDGKVAQCKLCQSVLKTTGSSTKGLHTHLASKHDIKILPDQQPSSSTEQDDKDNLKEIDTLLFIEEVKRHPGLWNTSKVSFHDRDKKIKLWFNVCSVFCEDFDQKDQQEKKDYSNKIMMKWKKIKHGYENHLRKKAKSGLPAESGKQYIYGQQLSFLQHPHPKVETECSFDENDDEECIDDVEEEVDKKPRQFKKFSDPLRTKTNEFESSFINFVKRPIPIQADTNVVQNSDKSFFDSILPSIKDFTEDQRLELRCDILNSIKRLRTSSREQNFRCSPKNVSYSNLPSNVSYDTNGTPTNSSHNLSESQFHHTKPSKFYPEVIMHQTPLPPTSSSTPSTSNSLNTGRSQELLIEHIEHLNHSSTEQQTTYFNSR